MKIMRAIIWSAAMAICWLAPTCFCICSVPIPVFDIGFSNGLTLFAITLVMGSGAGVVAALCAPLGETMLPFGSPTFTQIGSSSAGITFFGLIVMSVAHLISASRFPLFDGPHLLLICLFAYLYGLFFAVKEHRANQKADSG